ncbi:glycoside hydrolase family 81 protein [Amanita muscaria Koide BX008]|uniref:glucan endo-1,3-beta-D-glucosidase n=1 Tax=Amanita muscaria (strain Koide BX008) TaxID=946122 RepID=A0A0C2WHT4_AMAMK|nr:glycoside hydrolase family 81 protein [Amanita muscaria Koide BX008]
MKIRSSLSSTLAVLVLSGVNARPLWHAFPWTDYLTGKAALKAAVTDNGIAVKVEKPVFAVDPSAQIPAVAPYPEPVISLGRDHHGEDLPRNPYAASPSSPTPPNQSDHAASNASKKRNKIRRDFGGDVFNDLFAPIATTAPPDTFSRRFDHPVPRLSITDQDRPLQTNKFYSNLYLGSQSFPAYTYPYSVWFSKGALLANGTREPFGLSVSHVEQDQRVFGPTGSLGSGSTGAIEYYLNPTGIRSINLGAIELNPAVSSPSMELTNLEPMSVDVNFYVNKTLDATRKMHTSLCLGMGFISAEYSTLTPQIDSGVIFQNLTVVQGPNPSVLKYKVTLGDGKIWVIYAHPDPNVVQAPFSLTRITNSTLRANGTFSGIVQVAKVGKAENAAVEAVLDQATGGMCTGASVSAQTSGGSVASYQINYTRYNGTGPLLMFALPHHYHSFTNTTIAALQNVYQLTSLAKGMMIAVLSDQWDLREDSMPTSIGWMPVKSRLPPLFAFNSLAQLDIVAQAEVSQDFDAQATVHDELYFAGKIAGKLAYICITAHLVLNDRKIASACLTKLKKTYSLFTAGNNQYKLVYEDGWRGIVPDAVFQTGNITADFGAGYYNDHHFQYSYLIHVAAVIAYLDDPSQGYDSGKWLTANKDWVNALVRDVANPSSADNYFPVSRSFDYWHGHSWATGLFESIDGKNEESSSEDVNFAYAMKMWGYASGQPLVEARGNLMLAILRRSINTYMLISPQNSPNPTNPTPWSIHPAEFNPNRVSGILSENKVDHTTFFGDEPRYIQGIHMLPITPISQYIRSEDFARDEWNAFFAEKTDAITDGWKGLLYQNVALWDPLTSWQFFVQSGFQTEWLDGGESRTWSLAFAGLLGGGVEYVRW